MKIVSSVRQRLSQDKIKSWGHRLISVQKTKNDHEYEIELADGIVSAKVDILVGEQKVATFSYPKEDHFFISGLNDFVLETLSFVLDSVVIGPGAGEDHQHGKAKYLIASDTLFAADNLTYSLAGKAYSDSLGEVVKIKVYDAQKRLISVRLEPKQKVTKAVNTISGKYWVIDDKFVDDFNSCCEGCKGQEEKCDDAKVSVSKSTKSSSRKNKGAAVKVSRVDDECTPCQEAAIKRLAKEKGISYEVAKKLFFSNKK